MNKPELLAPAGNIEKLRLAIHYGADAVYLGANAFGLRNMADNFTLTELAEAVRYAHEHEVKVYLALNAYLENHDLPNLRHYLEDIARLPIDAYIAADPGVIATIHEVSPRQPIHLSTQANSTNWQSVRFWQEQGICRVNLAREMSLDDIREVRQRVDCELEVFVHGAMCISYSGRCLLSSVMTGRGANKGECAHPCRWNYALLEETRPGEYFPVLEDEKGTFIFNSKDLCLLQHLPELVESGVNSLKIEGRMKGIHYVATIVRVYREALDRLYDDPTGYVCQPEWLEELCSISHRGYTTGFLLGPTKDLDREFHSRYIRSHDLVGLVEDTTSSTVLIGVRNRIKLGDTLDFIGRDMKSLSHTLLEMTNETGEPLLVANPNQRIRLKLPFNLERYDIVRRKK